MPDVIDLYCERLGCKLPAEYERLTTDMNARGHNLNEPGARIETLCACHAAEVRQYIGGRIWKIERGEPCQT